MERIQGYEFDDTEQKVLADALAMYSAYMQEMVMPMLVGDESDIETVSAEASAAQRMAHHFVEEVEDKPWEELSYIFQNCHGRPMDMSDYSDFDWFEYRKEEQ